MALSIRDAETDRLARELAALTGESMTEAIRKALAERLVRTRAARDDELGRLIANVRAIQERVAQLPVLDDRPEDEILGYDADGLPR
jgi:antitoxin VapB